MLNKIMANLNMQSHHTAAVKGNKPSTELPKLNLLTAPKDSLPISKDVQLKSGTIYEAADLKSVLSRMSDKKHPPIWLMLNKQSDTPQNTPDKVVLLERDKKGNLNLSFTDIEGSHKINLGHASSKASKMDKLADKIHENLGYVRYFMKESNTTKELIQQADNNIGMGKGRVSVSLNQPGIPGLKLPGPIPRPTASIDEIRLTGAARWPNKSLDNSSSPDNQAYSSSMWRHARGSGKHIKEGQVTSYRQLWRDATDWRLSTIKNKQTPDLQEFVLPRSLEKFSNSLYITPLHSDGPYAYMKDRFIEKAEHYDIPVEKRRSKDGGENLNYTDFSQLGNNEVDLNHIYLSTPPNSEINESVSLGTIHHTAGFQINEIMNHIESSFQEAMSGELSPSESMDKIAEMHWWVTNSCPDFRGSAAKAEYCARAMSEALGIEMPPFKDGILPDLEAMAMSKDDFVKAYSSLLERPPI